MMRYCVISKTANVIAKLIRSQSIRRDRIRQADDEARLRLGNGKMLLDASHHVNYHNVTVKHIRWARMPFLVMLLLWLPARIHAEDAPLPPSGFRIVSPGSAAQPRPLVVSIQSGVRPHAEAVAIHGKCDCSMDGVTFTNLERGHIFEQGSVIRTGDSGSADLFFWRTGATVRLQAGTEIRFEKMVFGMKAGRPAVDAVLELRAGRIFTLVRAANPDSTLEIKGAAGRSVVEGSRDGRYIITADGSLVSDKDSTAPLKLIGENGTTIIGAGEQFTRLQGKTPFVPSATFGQDLAQLNELQVVAEEAMLKTPPFKRQAATALSR
jgi:hypothetical protein